MSSLPPIPTLTTQQRLDAARAAYHRLLTGGLRETVDHNGTRIQYTKTNADDLKAYIAELEGDIVAGIVPLRRRRMIVNNF